ncbi:MAG: IS91 family transposase [Deltaproteobacteria bacterium]|nr:IS91 family transposase [Deltaproteobacteria bacterium]
MKTFYKPEIEIADLFHRFGHELGELPYSHQKVIRDITTCRTSQLGGHSVRCDECEYQKNSYNSCRNRHCPKCQFLSQLRWIDKRTKDLLPCQYFHVVFTIPSELNPLILRNKDVGYDILFRAASESLKDVAQNPKQLGAEIGFIGVLHTWAQNLVDHPHIHFIVPAGGLNKKKTAWVHCKKDFFLSVRVLSTVFRGKMLEALERAFDDGKLKFMGKIEHLKHFPSFKEILVTAASKDWVVYAKEPFNGPKQVINYLGQYTHRIAISNYRLVKLEGNQIHFKVRDRENPKEKKILVLDVRVFLRRFLLHILPKGYVRIRHFGLLGSRLKKENIRIVKAIQGIIEVLQTTLPLDWKALLRQFTGLDPDLCPQCKIGTLFTGGIAPP